MAEPNQGAPGSGSVPPQPSSGAPPNIQKLVATKRLQQAQAQVGEVVDIMRVNVEKVLERDQKLSEMDRRADELQEGASQFQQQAVKLKKKAWWENFKMWIILGFVVLTIIIVILVVHSGAKSPSVTGEVVGAPNNVPEVVPTPNTGTEGGKFLESSAGPLSTESTEPVLS